MRDRAGSLARLHELAALRDGWYWDGEGKEVTRKAIDTAYALTSRDPQPYLYPMLDGGVHVEWDDGCEVKVLPDGTIDPECGFGTDIEHVLNVNSFYIFG